MKLACGFLEDKLPYEHYLTKVIFMATRQKATVLAQSNVQNQDILSITIPMINRMRVEAKTEQTIKSYVRDRRTACQVPFSATS